MFRFSEKQLAHLGEAQVAGRVEQMARQLRLDFPDELASRDETFERDVESLAQIMRRHGFRSMSHIYRLVAWGVFLGPDYIRDAVDGKLAQIAALDIPEAERFWQIRQIVTADGFQYGDAPDDASNRLFDIE